MADLAPIAIVGLGGLFSGSPDLEQFWYQVRHGIDTSRSVPEGRWVVPPELVMHPASTAVDQVPHNRGYYLDPFVPKLEGLEVDPLEFQELDPLFHLILHVGNQAFRSARMTSVDRSRIGVILGSIALPTDRISQLVRERIEGESAVNNRNRLVTGYPALLLSRALGLGGTAYTLDAACASSLYALKLAIDQLRCGTADAMLSGGFARPDCLYTQMGFAQLRALSPSGHCRPFDQAGDGLLVGEGGALFVLKRLDDALRHGDQIHGLIAAVGLANDIEGNLLLPASEGQLRAMHSAYASAGWSPADIDLLECHATGTPVGDRIEFASLQQLRHGLPAHPCVIGSVKSTVGHLLTGANAAGLMKVLLAFKHRELPPSANFSNPAAGIDLVHSPFRILERAQPWPARATGKPRRAAVSGFGFGGIDAHLLVEEWIGQSVPAAPDRAGSAGQPTIVITSMACRSASNQDPTESANNLLLDPDPPCQPLHDCAIPYGVFPIPPVEMNEMLGQQLLLLQVAEEVQASSARRDNLKTGVFIAVELEIRTALFHTRWWLMPFWSQQAASDRARALDQASLPLTANRTMGALASIAASRIARTYRCGGPAFTISALEHSGLAALEVAQSMLRSGEIDRAIVGSVVLAANQLEPEPGPDFAVALILERQHDTNDQPFFTASEPTALPKLQQRIPALLQAHGHDHSLWVVARCWAALHCKQIPATHDHGPEPWLHDRLAGPRCARIRHQGKKDVKTFWMCQESSRRPTPTPELEQTVFLLSGSTKAQLREQQQALFDLTQQSQSLPALGHRWWKHTQSMPRGNYRLAFHARSLQQVKTMLDLSMDGTHRQQPGIYFQHVLERRKLAFIYPGSGNHYEGMGRELYALFPSIWQRQELENRRLRSQYAIDSIWHGRGVEPDPCTVLFAQVAFGTFMTDLLRSFALEPDAVLGYSLGESASLFGMRVWRDRDLMLDRIERSSLFRSDLAAPYRAAQRSWGWGDDRAIDWVTAIVPVSAATIQSAMDPGHKTYLLIINSANECVVGGQRQDLEILLAKLRTTMLEVKGVTLAHCPVANPVRQAYRDLHLLPVSPLPGTRFYSTAWGRSYEMSEENAAEAILAAVLQTLDFPRVVQQAYQDGVRHFVEIGPGSSCARMIDNILLEQPHECLVADSRHNAALPTILDLLARLHVLGESLDLSPLYPTNTDPVRSDQKDHLIVPLSPHPAELIFPDLPAPQTDLPEIFQGQDPFQIVAFGQQEAGLAHETFLRFTQATLLGLADTLAYQNLLLSTSAAEGCVVRPALIDAPAAGEPPRAFEYEQCLEFARGSIARVLGPRFEEIDRCPTRVRLPDGPLMLVDRILEVEGEPISLSAGRVRTCHAVSEKRWYLDGGRMPTCVAVEAGQADLFLSGFLGIDFATRGLAVYRLLDAEITFHRELPACGETIEYDIHIDQFFTQGDTHLFRFRFEGTVAGQPLLTMKNGCAGFFTAADLASGKGIVHTRLDRLPQPGKVTNGWQPLAPMEVARFPREKIEALRLGDLETAFGPAFAQLALVHPMRLPGGMLRLVDRVKHLDPTGGRYGLGLIHAEADIHPDDWFLTCHFVDDMVMPGTLMYECCLHTLRILLMRMGMVGEEGEVVCQPVPGVASKLKCRGQVITSTRTAGYEVSIKEIGYRPEPYAIADALMYADGKPIVEMSQMSLRLTGLDRERLEKIWAGKAQTAAPALYNYDRILAFAVGKPSTAFGEPYRIFDSERVIARLPGPPFQFLDRIVQITGEPWKMVAGAEIVAAYDVPPDAWYFAANRKALMPFSVLLEVALQPCGWLAAYIGSALTSPIDLSFRNLGGQATATGLVTPSIGCLTTRVKITRVSSSGGMIIQHYDFSVHSAQQEIYRGTTYFGFFTRAALANQIGLRECALLPQYGGAEQATWSGLYPRDFPYPDSKMRMVDHITWYADRGGPRHQGAIEGRILVDPTAWFFKAHFYQDPVWPGSLGLESFLQLGLILGEKRWGCTVTALELPSRSSTHNWTYRGQVLPTDREVTVQAWVTEVDDQTQVMTIAGLLGVDGRIIYQMTGFTLSIVQ